MYLNSVIGSSWLVLWDDAEGECVYHYIYLDQIKVPTDTFISVSTEMNWYGLKSLKRSGEESTVMHVIKKITVPFAPPRQWRSAAQQVGDPTPASIGSIPPSSG